MSLLIDRIWSDYFLSEVLSGKIPEMYFPSLWTSKAKGENLVRSAFKIPRWPIPAFQRSLEAFDFFGSLERFDMNR